MLKLTRLFLSVFLTTQLAWGADTCSRVATVNYQEVLVDTSSSNLGEGLRYYLQKDQIAKELLDEYQANNKSTWKSAALSTTGIGMIIGSLVLTDGGNGRNILLFGGLGSIALSYLISKTNQHNNEYLLQKSVEEYNKRNTPRIFFSPTGTKENPGFGMGVSQEF